MMPVIPTVPQLPAPPIRGVDTNEAFSAKVDAREQAMNPWVDSLNAFAPALVSAAAAANYSATSETELTIGMGVKSLTVEDGKLFQPGQFVVLAAAADPTVNFMTAQIASYDFDTGAMEVDVVSPQGSGSISDWFVALTSSPADANFSVSPAFVGTPFEDVYTITDGASVDLDPANGSIQLWTLGANRTPTTSLSNGQSLLLLIDDGTAYSITWSTIGVIWKTDAGAAPTLNASGRTLIVLSKVGGVVYGARVGDA